MGQQCPQDGHHLTDFHALDSSLKFNLRGGQNFALSQQLKHTVVGDFFFC